jgi:predicted metal-dependent hydrolase
MAGAEYDPRYLAGIVLFNRGDWFEAHEVWEDLWQETSGPPRRFYQGLIQAAVALCHFHNGNRAGALKLYHSSRNYLAPFQPVWQGLDLVRFEQQMGRCFADLLAGQPGTLDPALVPTLTLDPPPEHWPEPPGDSHG